MSVPMVSVVIPTWHRETDVVRAARSALRQSGVEIEVIVLDDSAENSAERHVAGIADARVRYVRCVTPSDGVPARVRNRGLALARGEFVHFLDDDDELEEGALGTLSTALATCPEIGVAIGIVRPVGDDEAVLERERAYFEAAACRLSRFSTTRHLCAAILFSSTPLVNSACMVRRDTALAVGGYAEDVSRCEDVDFYLRAVRHSGFRFVDRTVVRYQTGRPSLMHSLEDNGLIIASYRTMHRRYRQDHGLLEFLTLRLHAFRSSQRASNA